MIRAIDFLILCVAGRAPKEAAGGLRHQSRETSPLKVEKNRHASTDFYQDLEFRRSILLATGELNILKI